MTLEIPFIIVSTFLLSQDYLISVEDTMSYDDVKLRLAERPWDRKAKWDEVQLVVAYNPPVNPDDLQLFRSYLGRIEVDSQYSTVLGYPDEASEAFPHSRLRLCSSSETVADWRESESTTFMFVVWFRSNALEIDNTAKSTPLGELEPPMKRVKTDPSAATMSRSDSDHSEYTTDDGWNRLVEEVMRNSVRIRSSLKNQDLSNPFVRISIPCVNERAIVSQAQHSQDPPVNTFSFSSRLHRGQTYFYRGRQTFQQLWGFLKQSIEIRTEFHICSLEYTGTSVLLETLAAKGLQMKLPVAYIPLQRLGYHSLFKLCHWAFVQAFLTIPHLTTVPVHHGSYLSQLHAAQNIKDLQDITRRMSAKSVNVIFIIDGLYDVSNERRSAVVRLYRDHSHLVSVPRGSDADNEYHKKQRRSFGCGKSITLDACIDDDDEFQLWWDDFKRDFSVEVPDDVRHQIRAITGGRPALLERFFSSLKANALPTHQAAFDSEALADAQEYIKSLTRQATSD